MTEDREKLCPHCHLKVSECIYSTSGPPSSIKYGGMLCPHAIVKGACAICRDPRQHAPHPAPPAEEKIEPASEKHYKGCRCENKSKSCNDGEAFIAAVRAANKVRIEQEPNDAPAMVSNALIAMLAADHQAMVTADERIKALEETLMSLMADPFGCPMCDSGTLRNETKDHWPNCGWVTARSLIAVAKKEKKG